VPEALNRRLLDVLNTLAADLVDSLEADACAISRVIGDVLIMIAERVPDERTLLHGQGYLVSDYPQTAEVLETRVPRALTLADPDVDDAEATVLREQGFGSVVMVPLDVHGAVWGLVEVYRLEPVPFTGEQVEQATRLSRLS
jgi:transcriptional regulator with GAF, ATPase, and Fis domain